MLFNSIDFILFFLIFFILYWFVFKNYVKAQNLLILISSYIFMAWWDVRFLIVLIVSSAVYYFVGIRVAASEENERKQGVWVSLGVVFGVVTLFFFKSHQFFIDTLIEGCKKINIDLNLQTLNIILPLGISFYTFRGISYLLDIRSGKATCVKNSITFFSYLAFFPSLLSGPIDKARDFVPQLEKKRFFESAKASDGLRHIIWGLFKKIVIADNCMGISAHIFDNYQLLPGSTLLLGSFFYAIELYADFSGYSDMAVGVAKLMGFDIINNFKLPFFSQNIAEFWQKWHISLTAWVTEYVFTPLSFIFRAYSKPGVILAIIINFVLVGLWHGLHWTFLVYGFLHGCYFIPLILKGTVNANKSIAKDRLFPSAKELFKVTSTFLVVMLTFILFNSGSLTAAMMYYKGLFSMSLFSMPVMPEGIRPIKLVLTFIFIATMFFIEWIGRQDLYVMDKLGSRWLAPVRWTLYYAMLFLIFYFSGAEQQFIYFQF